MNARNGFGMWLTGLLANTALDDKIAETIEAMNEAFDGFEAEIRTDAVATVRAQAPKYLESDVDVHTFRVLDAASAAIAKPGKES